MPGKGGGGDDGIKWSNFPLSATTIGVVLVVVAVTCIAHDQLAHSFWAAPCINMATIYDESPEHFATDRAGEVGQGSVMERVDKQP